MAPINFLAGLLMLIHLTVFSAMNIFTSDRESALTYKLLADESNGLAGTSKKKVPKTLQKSWWGKNSEYYTSPIYSSDVIEAQTMSMSKDPQNSKTQGRRLASSSPIQPSQVIDPRTSANAANPHRSIEKVNLENKIIAENTENLNHFARVIYNPISTSAWLQGVKMADPLDRAFNDRYIDGEEKLRNLMQQFRSEAQQHVEVLSPDMEQHIDKVLEQLFHMTKDDDQTAVRIAYHIRVLTDICGTRPNKRSRFNNLIIQYIKKKMSSMSLENLNPKGQQMYLAMVRNWIPVPSSSRVPITL
ncbi:hypothetical protein PGT21_029599 [Puccinia graminis f. sp. tritici]|uniref:Uncharacterized protein n=1 Tax=Puccinia graminis f. sp. tritici TaxID=56615 RepID=A0A5B0QBL3_PUCGR|nr:hypothetical protein PGT21_029599 [Puccinia graminis f. sp. tritici]